MTPVHHAEQNRLRCSDSPNFELSNYESTEVQQRRPGRSLDEFSVDEDQPETSPEMVAPVCKPALHVEKAVPSAEQVVPEISDNIRSDGMQLAGVARSGLSLAGAALSDSSQTPLPGRGQNSPTPS